MTVCPKCQHENDDGVQICTYCGAPLIDLLDRAATRTLDNTNFEEGTPKWGSARFGMRTILSIGVEGKLDTFTFDANVIDKLVIGRGDPRTGEMPEINLSGFNAIEKGVSRRHAFIVRRDGSLYLVDNDSANGTFLNGQKLVAQQPRVLRDGDDIRLGYLVIRITFRTVSSST